MTEGLKNVYYLEEEDISPDGEIVGFKSLGGKNKPVFSMIYAGWCPHCVTLKPEFQKLSDEIRKMGEPVYIAAIQQDGKVSQSQANLGKNIKQVIPGFRGFPTLMLYKDGKPVKSYEGERTFNGMMKFIKENM